MLLLLGTVVSSHSVFLTAKRAEKFVRNVLLETILAMLMTLDLLGKRFTLLFSI